MNHAQSDDRRMPFGPLVRLLWTFVAAHLTGYGLLVLSWLLLGRAALAGSVTGATIASWTVATAAGLVCRTVAIRMQAALAVTAGDRLRRRLLRGALGLDPSAVRREGTGHLLGRVLETESLEDLAIGGALNGLAAVLELMLAAVLLTAALGWTAPAALAFWLAAAMLAVRRYAHHREAWTSARITLGNDLAEKMAGHRTRSVQQRPADRHEGEDAALAEYESLARRMDRRFTVLIALIPRGWALTGLALLAAAAGTGAREGTIAAGAMGVLLTFGSLIRLVTGLAGFADARCSWAQLQPLLATHRGERTAGECTAGDPYAGHGAGHRTSAGHIPTTAPDPDPTRGAAGDSTRGTVLIEAEDVSYRYPGRDQAALRDVDLRIRAGDRVLIEGRSGSGKSTLADLLAGARPPAAGRLSLHGTDLAAIGPARWRRRVLAVPQSDHNHLILGTLAMNLLIGRSWPAPPEDLRVAEQTCRALGLGDLLDRMPSGLAQIVGETGWQLSHGERSLVFLARALLCRAEVVILDETFGALDPQRLRVALGVTLDRAPTLAVIRQ